MEKVRCSRCKRIKLKTLFYTSTRNKSGLRNECKLCSYYSNTSWQKRNSKIRNRHQIAYIRSHPWVRFLGGIWSRCYNSKCPTYSWYGGRGIRTSLSSSDLKILWFRDKAWKLKKPSIDRINVDGNYTRGNCRFMELADNIRRKYES